MKRFEQKRSYGREKPYRSRAKTFSRSKSTANILLKGRAFGEENLQVRRRVEALEIVSDSSSCSSYSTEDDLFAYELKQTGGAPIKKLLAEELSKEMETRRRPPSVIARLMGLDALPSQQPIQKQQKIFSENYLKRAASIGYPDKCSSYDDRSRRMSNKEQQEFKDVFEVLETSKAEKHPDFLVQKGMTNSKISETKMEFIRQKFRDVKRLSTDETLQQSKEFHDALEVLDSNKDLLLKFLQEPDSVFTKHLHDRHGVPSPPQSGHITVLKSSNAQGSLCRKPDRKAELSNVAGPFQKHEPGIISHLHDKNVHISSKDSKSRHGEKNDTRVLPTRIVVLKPNIRKVPDTERPVSSPCSSGGFALGHTKGKEFRSCENMELFEEVWDWRNSSIESELTMHRTRGTREIAKEITRQMKYSVSSGSMKVPSSRLRGYAGDESSYSVSGNDSANESEVPTPTSSHFFDWKNRYSPSSSYSNESSVSREAKKRLSERWKMTHRVQEVGKVRKGSTLGEMLSVPDSETRSTAFDSIVGSAGFSDRLSRNGGVTRCGSPLGISSRDGWKDECARSLPRSRSLPASSTLFGSPKTSIRYGSIGKDKCSMPNEGVNRRSNKSKRVDSKHREEFSTKGNTRSSGKKSHYSLCVGGEKNHPVLGTDLKPDEPKINLDEADWLELEPRTLGIPDDDHVETIPITDEIAIAKPEDSEISFESSHEHQSKETGCITSMNDGVLSAHNTDNSNPEETPIGPIEESSFFSHCTIAEAESPASCKEAGQPSPVSVLEPPFVDDFSSGSDSFEKVCADLHGLRMQLQLLKLESSDGYSERFDVSSDEDIREGSIGLPNENREANGKFKDILNRDFSYVVDVLIDSGFQDADLDVLLKTCYSAECPVSPSVFEVLDKKYGAQTTWLRSERKLTFDRINLGLMMILQPHMDQHPWVRQERTLGLGWKGESLVEELWSLLVRQEKEVRKDSLDKVLMKEMKWLDLGDEIDTMGSEIEGLLFDELVAEVVVY